MHRPVRSLLVVALLLAGSVACGSDESSDEVLVDVPADATFCSIFNGAYADALAAAVPATDDGFEESAALISAWAAAMADLAPTEIAELAADNLGYHQAQENKQSAADYIPGSNEMQAWARANC